MSESAFHKQYLTLDTITDAETAFLKDVVAGKVHDAKGAKISPEFVRDLLLNAAKIPYAEFGVGLKNAVITGTLVLFGANINRVVSFQRCTFVGNLEINYAAFKALFLDGSTMRQLKGVRSRFETSLYLRSYFDKNETDEKGMYSFHRFAAEGGVDVSGARIQGAFSARGAQIHPDERRHRGLNLDDTDIGSIILGPKGSPVGERPDAENSPTETPELPEDLRLAGRQASKEEDDSWRYIKTDPHGRDVDDCVVVGGITLQRARCNSFTDSEDLYQTILKMPDGKSELVLRGFTYQSLGRRAPRDIQFRKRWLQADARREEAFDPQPYEQLAHVLKNKGDLRASQSILISKERRILWTENSLTGEKRHKPTDYFNPMVLISAFVSVITTPWTVIRVIARILAKTVARAFMEPIGYGYRPHQLIPLVAGIILIGTVVFNRAYAAGWINPSNPLISRSEAWLNCSLQQIEDPWSREVLMIQDSAITLCKKAPLEEDATEGERALYFYPDFHSFWYAMDVFLPILNLRQEDYWLPEGHHTWGSLRAFTHIFTLLGWILSSLGIVGALSHLNRNS
ncbi:hypothetical protein [Ponticaulis koreensis]|uniref:hypothetical protein n=1 Tax=Ponticaulis koreensis TaxID=1123045 RepID=UPI0003B68A7C|nr:hypothetical protein [Ponticaulis koreensis]